MNFKRFALSFLFLALFVSLSCGGGKEKPENKTSSAQDNSLIKIGDYEWFFNNQGLNKAIEKAKETDKLIFAVFSSKW